MNIKIINIRQGFDSTLSTFIVDTVKKGYILQDEDRGLTSDMSLSQIAKIKVYGSTAIPTGRYRVDITYSEKFGCDMPEILNVPGFGGVRFHKGNRIIDTKACPLPGETYDQDKNGYYRVWNSGKVFDPFFASLRAAKLRKEAIWCEVSRLYIVTGIATQAKNNAFG